MNLALGHRRSSSLNFRVATDKSDIPALVTLAREAHAESRFSYIPFSVDKVSKIANRAIGGRKRSCIFIAEREAEAIGFAYCALGEYHIGADVLIATIHNINVPGKIRKTLVGGKAAVGLFSGAMSWARARGASELLLHVTSGINLEKTHIFF